MLLFFFFFIHLLFSLWSSKMLIFILLMSLAIYIRLLWLNHPLIDKYWWIQHRILHSDKSRMTPLITEHLPLSGQLPLCECSFTYLLGFNSKPLFMDSVWKSGMFPIATHKMLLQFLNYRYLKMWLLTMSCTYLWTDLSSCSIGFTF